MWSNVISIDKRYKKETDYILDSLQNTQDISYALEESADRLWIYLASACERQDAVEARLCSMLSVVFLSFFKLRYFARELRIKQFTHATCAMISSMLHFDREFEKSVVSRVLATSLDYNVDGLLNFRLRALRDSWSELAEVAGRLLDTSGSDNDIYDIAAFITGSDGGSNRLLVSRNRLRNMTRRTEIEVVNLFDEEEFNLLSAIISQKPAEILLDKCDMSDPMCNTLRKIARVIHK